MVIASVATGSYGWHLAWQAFLHFCVGCIFAYLCCINAQESRSQYAKVRHGQRANMLSRKMLHTLIPPNVLARLATHSYHMGILATEIPSCTIMFCSLKLPGRGQMLSGRCESRSLSQDAAEFEQLDSLYLDFDGAVQE